MQVHNNLHIHNIHYIVVQGVVIDSEVFQDGLNEEQVHLIKHLIDYIFQLVVFFQVDKVLSMLVEYKRMKVIKEKLKEEEEYRYENSKYKKNDYL